VELVKEVKGLQEPDVRELEIFQNNRVWVYLQEVLRARMFQKTVELMHTSGPPPDAVKGAYHECRYISNIITMMIEQRKELD